MAPKKISYQVFVGKKNRNLYLNQWYIWDNAKPNELKFAWHWAAFFCTFYWLIYRKMWRYALSYSVFLLTIIMIGFLIGHQADWFLYQTDGVVKFLLVCVMWIIMPCIAHYLYYHHAKIQIAKAQQQSVFGEEQQQDLKNVVGTLSTLKMLTVIFVSLVFFY